MKAGWKGWLGLALLAAAGCSGRVNDFGRPLVSSQLEERTGASVGPGDGSLPPSVSLDDGITENEAVAVALWNNAAFQEALAELGFKRAEIIQAGVLPNPGLSVLFPLGPKQFEFTAKMPLEIFLFRPGRIEAAELDAERTASLLVQNGLNVIRDVTTAFADLRLAVRRAAATSEIAEFRKRAAELAWARVAAGAASEFEITGARAQAELDRIDAARASFEEDALRARLLSLMGLPPSPRSFRIALDPAPRQGTPPEAADLIFSAMAARPDLRAAQLGMQVAAERAGLARWEWLALTAIMDANDRKGKEGLEIGPGVDVPIPLFNSNQGGKARADAEVERATRHYAAVGQRIALEVREARLRWETAKAAVDALAARVVPELEAAAQQAERALAAGGVSLDPVLEAGARLAEARLRLAEAEAGLRRAWADLERSVGRRLK